MKGFIILCVSFMIVVCEAKNLPSFIKKCKRGDQAELNKCLVERAKEVKERLLVNAIPEMKLPLIDPLHVNKLEIHTANGKSVGFDAVFTNMSAYGAKHFQVKELNFDLDKKHIFIHTFIPNLHVNGTYEFNGKILLLKLASTGQAVLDINDIDSVVHMNVSIVKKNNKEYIALGEDFQIARTYGKASLYFHDLFKKNQKLTEDTNKSINENIKDFHKEIEPLLDSATHLLVTEILKEFFGEFSLDELFD